MAPVDSGSSDWVHVEHVEAALQALQAQVAELKARLQDIATREWRDEGGRIAAAIARDGLSDSNPYNRRQASADSNGCKRQ